MKAQKSYRARRMELDPEYREKRLEALRSFTDRRDQLAEKSPEGFGRSEAEEGYLSRQNGAFCSIGRKYLAPSEFWFCLNSHMNERQQLEVRILETELEPIQSENDVSCIGPAELISEFLKFLETRKADESGPDLLKTVASGSYGSDDQLVWRHRSLVEVQMLVGEFTLYLVRETDCDIAGFWGGFLPVNLVPRVD